jgi:pilus assembly protein Flp/PilA
VYNPQNRKTPRRPEFDAEGRLFNLPLHEKRRMAADRPIRCTTLSERKTGELMMRWQSLAAKMGRFLVSDDGPTAVEYAVMLALIVVVCLTAITAIGTKASTTFTKASSKLGS